ncbi:MAG: hypothetical protein K0S51_540 [Bacillales bacterium]|jgi:hypothetical protein|nr:hypothetical protein [Bacillales bacterium]
MEKFIMTIVSMIILIPILLFLPFGLNRKGKLILGIFSYIIACLGVLSSLIYTFEITIVLLLSLIIVSTFLFSRMPRVFFGNPTNKSKRDLRFIKSVQVKSDLDTVSKVFIKEEEKVIEEEIVNLDEKPTSDEMVIENEKPNFDELVIADEELFFEEIANVVEEELIDDSISPFEVIEPSIDGDLEASVPNDILTNNSLEEVVDEDWEEDVSFLINRSDEQSLKDIQDISDEFKVPNYMSEIEQLISGEVPDISIEDQEHLEQDITDEDFEIDVIENLKRDSHEMEDQEEDNDKSADLWEEIVVDPETKDNKGVSF